MDEVTLTIDILSFRLPREDALLVMEALSGARCVIPQLSGKYAILPVFPRLTIAPVDTRND